MALTTLWKVRCFDLVQTFYILENNRRVRIKCPKVMKK